MRSGTPADLFSTAGSVLESPDQVEIDHRVYPVSQCNIFEDWIQQVSSPSSRITLPITRWHNAFAWIPGHCGISDNIDMKALTTKTSTRSVIGEN